MKPHPSLGLWLSPKGLTHGPQGEDAHTNGVAGATLEGVQRYNRRCSSTHGITADLIEYPVELRGARGGGAKEDGAQRNGAQRNGAQNEDGAQGMRGAWIGAQKETNAKPKRVPAWFAVRPLWIRMDGFAPRMGGCEVSFYSPARATHGTPRGIELETSEF